MELSPYVIGCFVTAGHRGDRWAPFEVHLETFSERARPLARLEPLILRTSLFFIARFEKSNCDFAELRLNGLFRNGFLSGYFGQM